jgi:hypothetical protein
MYSGEPFLRPAPIRRSPAIQSTCTVSILRVATTSLEYSTFTIFSHIIFYPSSLGMGNRSGRNGNGTVRAKGVGFIKTESYLHIPYKDVSPLTRQPHFVKALLYAFRAVLIILMVCLLCLLLNCFSLHSGSLLVFYSMSFILYRLYHSSRLMHSRVIQAACLGRG